MPQSKHGCHNTKRSEGYYGQDGWMIYSEDPHEVKYRIPVAVYIADRMSQACQYRVHAKDDRCEGCVK